VRFSPNGKFLAVALLDSTVKVFYRDTLKFFVSLYGHKVRLHAFSTFVISQLFLLATRTQHGYLPRFKADRDLFC
jgi:U3 small nucleolar RNA-associated protein 12